MAWHPASQRQVSTAPDATNVDAAVRIAAGIIAVQVFLLLASEGLSVAMSGHGGFLGEGSPSFHVGIDGLD